MCEDNEWDEKQKTRKKKVYTEQNQGVIGKIWSRKRDTEREPFENTMFDFVSTLRAPLPDGRALKKRSHNIPLRELNALLPVDIQTTTVTILPVIVYPNGA